MKLTLLPIIALILCGCTTPDQTDRITELESQRTTLIGNGLGPEHPRVRLIDEKLLELKEE